MDDRVPLNVEMDVWRSTLVIPLPDEGREALAKIVQELKRGRQVRVVHKDGTVYCELRLNATNEVVVG